VNAPFASTKSLDVLADRRARRVEAGRVALRLPPDLHLHARDPGRGPVAELLLQPRVGVRAEAAAAVDRHRVVRGAEQGDERDAEQPGLYVPERLVDRRDRTERDARTAGVADPLRQGEPGRPHVEGVAAAGDAGERRPDQLGRRAFAIRVAEPRFAARVRLDDDDRRRVPCERPVGFGSVGRDRARVHVEALHDGFDPGRRRAQPLRNSTSLPRIDFSITSVR
jgi:hypothetical protein